MTLQPGLQTIVTNILPNVSQSKGNQTMNFCQLIQILREILREIFSFKNCTENEARRLVPDHFSFF